MIREWIARAFSPRIRELEQANSDLRALLDKDFDKISCTRMSFDAKTGFKADLEGKMTGILASWAYNTLEAAGAKNFVELSFVHPKGGFLTITAQRSSSAHETPAKKCARLEREIESLMAKSSAA